MKRILLTALTALFALTAAYAQEPAGRVEIKEKDGFRWIRETYKTPDGETYAALTYDNRRITPQTKSAIRYREGGLFDLTDVDSATGQKYHVVYNASGHCVVPRDANKNAVRFLPDENLVVAWRYGKNYEEIPGSCETFSTDGHYYATGDFSGRKPAFEMYKRSMHEYNRKEEVAQQTTAEPQVEEMPVTEPAPVVQPQPVAVEQPAGEKPLFASKYIAKDGTNPDNGLKVNSDSELPIYIEIFDGYLTENGFKAMYVRTDSNGNRMYSGGVVGQSFLYTVDSRHHITKRIYLLGPAGEYTYVFKLTPKRK